MSTIQELKNKIQENKSKISLLNNENSRLTDQIRKLQRETQSVYYTIRCEPSYKTHGSHNKGIFSTFEKANSYLPEERKSRDSDNGCIWYYSIACIEGKDAYDLENLDNEPENFPYTGW